MHHSRRRAEGAEGHLPTRGGLRPSNGHHAVAAPRAVVGGAAGDSSGLPSEESDRRCRRRLAAPEGGGTGGSWSRSSAVCAAAGSVGPPLRSGRGRGALVAKIWAIVSTVACAGGRRCGQGGVDLHPAKRALPPRPGPPPHFSRRPSPPPRPAAPPRPYPAASPRRNCPASSFPPPRPRPLFAPRPAASSPHHRRPRLVLAPRAPRRPYPRPRAGRPTPRRGPPRAPQCSSAARLSRRAATCSLSGRIWADRSWMRDFAGLREASMHAATKLHPRLPGRSFRVSLKFPKACLENRVCCSGEQRCKAAHVGPFAPQSTRLGSTDPELTRCMPNRSNSIRLSATLVE